MKQVVAQGTFDLLHPGHLHYLTDAKSYGDRLDVIVARAENVTHKPKPIVPDRQRLEMVNALDPVDDARLGHLEDFFVPIREIDPDVIVLGHDQHHDEETLSGMLAAEGIDCSVVRASARDPDPESEGELLSTGRIIDRICDRRC
ncbi:adenylyltransferase/cytidyltransferase family protein [Natronomonas salsuginis]|uniref:FAD synthase n=1 Tax=Natronomonas salsuginis TaxID=2217661 RepID=A0A4U5J9W0_9EURY|nr:adenylyltransferase/cytidyltransferase family protein [Natronomonas salsuginis]TKR25295.1 FAD synthase [Natronomonas salsuginis]